ncbi:MAG TPA: hypothetical protein DIT67_09045 [Octadecabacter sp.]|mgnify:CR=1 FL=1|nr:hypothetical protein [Octadecabacter sp.]
MPGTKALLKQIELTRYAKALQAAGIEEWRVVVRRDGSHEIVAGKMDVDTKGPDPDELLR